MEDLPRRDSRFCTGKKMGSKVCIHKQYARCIPGAKEAAKKAGIGDYDIIRYDPKDESYSFIQSPDFDSSPEPVVGRSALLKGKTVTYRPPLKDPFIYHHKWLMVKDDYPGFDVEESKERSREWMKHIEKGESSKIGRKSYWEKNILPRLNK